MCAWDAFPSIMDCENCGADNASGARFCLSCGAALAAHGPRCASELPAGARFCPSCGLGAPPSTSPESSQSSRFTDGERKQVTVLFADFSGFTSFSETLDAEELRDRMVSIWARLDGILK